MTTSITSGMNQFILSCWDYGSLFISRIVNIIYQVYSLQVFFSKTKKKSPVNGVPIIPNGTWYGGHLHLMKEGPEEDFRTCLYRYSVEYADVHGRCTFYMGPTIPSLSVTRLQDVQLLLKATAYRTVFPVMEFHAQRFFGRNNLPTLTGNEWKTKRSIITKALHGNQFMKHNQTAIHVATETLVKQLKNKILIAEDDVAGGKIKLDVAQLMKMLTFDAFGQAALHVDFECCRNLQLSKIGKEFEFLSNELMRRITKDLLNPSSHIYCLPTESNRRFRDAKTYVESYIGKLIKERRQLIRSQSDQNNQSKIPQDLLTSLIQATSSSSSSSDDNIKGKNLVVVDENEEGEEMSILLDHLKTLLFAGHDTTSVALTYTLYLLSQHPDVERKCLNEIQQQTSTTTSSSSFDCGGDSMPYLEAVIMETLRLYPPVISTTRTLERDFELKQNETSSTTKTIHIPKGTYLYFPIWIIQRDDKNFDDPLTFRPERWMMEDGNSSSTSSIDVNKRSMLLSFSAGGRSCAGEKFARQELKIALSILLKHFSFKAQEDYVLTPHRPGIVQLPKGGVPMYISIR